LIRATWQKSAFFTGIDFYARQSALNWLGLRLLFEKFFAHGIGVGVSCALFYGTGRTRSIRYWN
jgi:hypothetical protein